MTTKKEGCKPKISAVICTYNRDQYLSKAIESLLDQSMARSEYELIVVDNASTDNTVELVKGYGDDIKYVYESNQGLSYAKNRGFRCSEADIVAYMDDDAIACHEWLENIIKAFDVDKEIAVVGGKIEPIWEGTKPAWVNKDFYKHYSCQDKGSEAFFLKGSDFLFGGNSAFRKKVLYECDGFPVKLGRIGKMQLVHEEWLVSKYIDSKGLKKYYAPEIMIRHHVMKNRLNFGWMINRFFWLGASAVYQEHLQTKVGGGGILMKFLKMLPAYFISTSRENYIMLLFNSVRYVGIIYGLCTFRHRLYKDDGMQRP